MNTYKNIDDLIKDLENFLEDNEYRLTYNGVPNDKVAAISENNCWLIINTITNLQEENEELKKKLDRRYYKNEYERIKEENERLKKPDYYEKGLIGSIKERDEIIQDYKSRCEKAIEYNYELQERYCHSAIRDELIASKIYEITERELNILQNGSDSQ